MPKLAPDHRSSRFRLHWRKTRIRLTQGVRKTQAGSSRPHRSSSRSAHFSDCIFKFAFAARSLLAPVFR